MHKSGKVLMSIGGVICIVGMFGFVVADAAVDPGTSNEFAGTVGTFYNDQLFYSVYTLSENFEDVTVTLTNVESGETWQLIAAPDGYFERDQG